MKFNCQNTLRTSLSCIVLFLFFSCSNDLLDETEELNAIQYQAKTSKTVTLTPIHDAFLQGSSSYNSSIIRLEETIRKGYLMFDLSKIEGQITSASLEFTISSDPGYGTIEVYLGNGDVWTETNLNTTNRPNAGAFLGSINKSYPLGSTEKISLKTDSLSAAKTSLILLHKNGNDLAFASKQTATPPKLTLTYNSSTSAPQASSPASVTNGYYVTVSGKSTNNGLSEGSAWNLEHAIKTASAGDVVYVKAGNYGNLKLIPNSAGTSDRPIKFIGYSNTPGDIVSNNGSTFKYGDRVDANKMPLLKGNAYQNRIAIRIQKDYVEIHNFQIQGYNSGLVLNGNYSLLKNIITYATGPQNVNSGSGKGIMVYGNNARLEDCFDYNSTSQGITLSGSKSSNISHCKVYSDNKINPNGYYILLNGGTSNSVVEDCIVYRDKDADEHRGHGLVLKDLATNNTIKNSSTYNTGIMVNFSGVKYNTFENINVQGSYSSDANEYSSNISINNGANNNTFENIYIKDSGRAIKFYEFDDGYVGEGGNRDLSQGGSNNKFINIQVNKAKNIIAAMSPRVGKSAFSNNNEFINCSFKNIYGTPFFSYQSMSNTKLVNCSFENIPNRQLVVSYRGGSMPLNFNGCSFLNVGFPIPK